MSKTIDYLAGKIKDASGGEATVTKSMDGDLAKRPVSTLSARLVERGEAIIKTAKDKFSSSKISREEYRSEIKRGGDLRLQGERLRGNANLVGALDENPKRGRKSLASKLDGLSKERREAIIDGWMAGTNTVPSADTLRKDYGMEDEAGDQSQTFVAHDEVVAIRAAGGEANVTATSPSVLMDPGVVPATTKATENTTTVEQVDDTPEKKKAGDDK